jgi:hypothetical protein
MLDMSELYFDDRPSDPLFVAQLKLVAEVKLVPRPLPVTEMRSLRDGLVEEQLLKTGDNLARHPKHGVYHLFCSSFSCNDIKLKTYTHPSVSYQYFLELSP